MQYIIRIFNIKIKVNKSGAYYKRQLQLSSAPASLFEGDVSFSSWQSSGDEFISHITWFSWHELTAVDVHCELVACCGAFGQQFGAILLPAKKNEKNVWYWNFLFKTKGALEVLATMSVFCLSSQIKLNLFDRQEENNRFYDNAISLGFLMDYQNSEMAYHSLQFRSQHMNVNMLVSKWLSMFGPECFPCWFSWQRVQRRSIPIPC